MGGLQGRLREPFGGSGSRSRGRCGEGVAGDEAIITSRTRIDHRPRTAVSLPLREGCSYLTAGSFNQWVRR